MNCPYLGIWKTRKTISLCLADIFTNSNLISYFVDDTILSLLNVFVDISIPVFWIGKTERRGTFIMDGRTRAEHSLIIQAKCRLHFPRFSADRIDKWFDRMHGIDFRLYLNDGLNRIDTRHQQPSFNLYSKGRAFYFALSCTFDTSTNNNNISLSLRNCQGDASESALLKAVEIAWKDEKTDTEEVRRKHKKMIEIPFNSTNKYQVSSSWRPCGIDVTFTHF